MITEWFVWLGLQIGGWFTSLFPKWTAPDFMVNFDDTVNGFFQNGAGLGAWFDFPVLFVCLGAVLLVYVATSTVKLLLKIAAFIPFFGGSG